MGRGEEGSTARAEAMLDRDATAEVHVARASDTVTTVGLSVEGDMGPAV